MPLVGEKVLDGTPLTRMEKKVEDVRLWIQETHSSQNPKVESTKLMYFQLKQSKYLERSSFISIPGVLVVLRNGSLHAPKLHCQEFDVLQHISIVPWR
jgi:hypothetical protein